MSYDDYIKAQKAGKKEYQHHLLQGDYPYLQSLEESISHIDIISEVSLGLQQIPSELIAGTRTAGRRTAFAPNFMPLLDPQSEFAGKWIHLCQSHLEEGIREPVTACEFMGRFYIMEGNKRVSVLKYFDAPFIPAIVTRLVPKWTDDVERVIYQEYMEFHRLTGINYLLVSRPGSYPALASAVAPALWDEETRMDFSSSYIKFKEAYLAKGGRKLPIQLGDALCTYVTIYGYPSLRDDSPAVIRENIGKLKNELALLTEERAVELVMDPVPDTPKKKIIDRILPAAPKKTSIAFIHSKNRAASSWTYAHELGHCHVEQVFGDRITTEFFENVTPGDSVQEAIRTAIDHGCTIIFTTSPEFLPSSLKLAVEHPEVKILNCSLNTSYHSIRTYYGRMYEAKFLCGMVAGSLADNNRLGYVADYPIYGVPASINAFALGARMVNPRAEVHLRWSTVQGENPEDYFRSHGISYVSAQDMIIPRYACRQYGLYRFDTKKNFGDEAALVNAATPLWNWGRFYEKIIASILAGSWNEAVQGKKALNYWWGLSAGVVDFVYSQNLNPGTKRLVEYMRRGIEAGTFHPFSGELYSQDGLVQKDENRILPPEEIITMDWLAQNVIGTIPEFDQLTDTAKAVVRLQGVKNS